MNNSKNAKGKRQSFIAPMISFAFYDWDIVPDGPANKWLAQISGISDLVIAVASADGSLEPALKKTVYEYSKELHESGKTYFVVAVRSSRSAPDRYIKRVGWSRSGNNARYDTTSDMSEAMGFPDGEHAQNVAEYFSSKHSKIVFLPMAMRLGKML
jgi:hypothetical protein